MKHYLKGYEYYYVSPSQVAFYAQQQTEFQQLEDDLALSFVQKDRAAYLSLQRRRLELLAEYERILAGNPGLRCDNKALEVSAILGKVFSGSTVDNLGSGTSGSFDAPTSASDADFTRLRAHNVGSSIVESFAPSSFAAQEVLGREVESARAKQIVKANKRSAAKSESAGSNPPADSDASSD